MDSRHPSRWLLFVSLMRPQQWIKNFFVAAPIFFGGALFDGQALLDTALTFLFFSLMSSAVYCLNDWVDLSHDKLHPAKRHRPLASGAISPKEGVLLMLLLAGLALGLSLVLPSRGSLLLLAILSGYLVLNMAYSLWLKHWPIVDVCIIAFGFVLRILAGGVASGIAPSKWLVAMTFLLTLFMALAKRRDDVLIWQRTGEKMRANVSEYNLNFLDHTITILVTTLMVAYLFYTLSDEVALRLGSDNPLYISSIFVLYTLLRYLQLTLVQEKSGSPTRLFWHDRGLQIGTGAWIICFALILYT